MAKICCAVLALVMLLCLPGCERQSPRQQSAGKKEKAAAGIIVAMGDSLTAGYGVDEEKSYPAQLQKKLEANHLDYTVINAGVSGETSSGALSRINWILILNPDIVILETGANDGLRGIDPSLTRRNISEILRMLKNNKIITILAGMKMLINLGPAYTGAFNRIYPKIAMESGSIFFPFFLEGVAADPALDIGDGIHPNGTGYAIIVNNLFPYVLEAIEKSEESG
jgi:acyl-CoA thioesterase-1